MFLLKIALTLLVVSLAFVLVKKTLKKKCKRKQKMENETVKKTNEVDEHATSVV